MTSVRSVYPDSEFLAQKGSGKNPELAKTDALANLSRYFQTTIESNLLTIFSSIEEGKNAFQKTEVLSEVNLSSNMSLFGVEFSDIYYQKKEKKYYCIAFIDRVYAWKIYEPTIKKEKKAFYDFYDEAIIQSQKDPLLALKYFVKAKEQGNIFLSVLEYGRLINEIQEKNYSIDRDTVASISKLQKDAIEKSILFIEMLENEGNIVLPKIEKSFSDNEFICSKIKDKSLYTVSVNINPNITIEDEESDEAMYISTPDINIVITNNINGRNIYSWAGKSTKKSISYTKENALKKAYTSLWEELGNTFKDGFNTVVYGEKV